MPKTENYFRFSKEEHLHTLNDRMPFKWKELIIWSPTSTLFAIWFFGIGIGLLIAVLSLIGYMLFRFAAWVFYSELIIDEYSGKLARVKKILNHTRTTELISEKFDSNRLEYVALKRSGKTKFLMNYRTHKNLELLIIRTKKDKELIEKYIAENIKI